MVKFETHQYTKKIRIRHKHAIFYPSVKFECFNKLLWYGKNIICVFANHECIQKTKQYKTKHLGQQDDKHTTSMRWTQVIAEMSCAERGWSHTAAYTPQRIARLPAAYDRHFCDHLRSTEDICRINCVHRTDVVRLVAISGISVVNWSHNCDQKYSSYEFSAFTCVNLSQPSVTYRSPSVTNP